MQYARIMNKAARDLVNGRGDAKTHISKILYYGAIQNAIFYSLQNAMFAMLFDDDEEDDEDKNAKKKERVVNGMVDGILRGAGIGGVLEPLQASPVIIEGGCFIGSRCIVVEGVKVEKEAVLGANVVLTKSTKIIDVTGDEPKEYKGVVPSRSVVIPGSYTKKFPAGEFQVPCAIIIGQRKASTDLKTSLNDVLRDFEVAV